MPIERQQMQIWRNSAAKVIESGDTMAAGELARDAVPRLIDEVTRLSAGSERDRIAGLMAQALVMGRVATGAEVAMVPGEVADKAYVLADALLDKRGG